MKNPVFARWSQINLKQWLALALSVALGGLLVAGLLFGLKPLSALAAGSAAPPADPATVYACTEAGLNNALSAGGSATFSCGVPTTVTVSARKTVSHNVTLDGGNNFILTGLGITGVFTVPAGVHLNLLNFTLRDAGQGAIYNGGVLNVTHSHFISDTAFALWNLPGSTATLSDTTVERGFTKLSAVINGNFSVTGTASLTVVNSTLHDNLSGLGAAIGNLTGTVNVIGSNFYANQATQGGAIWNQAQLSVSNSQFSGNVAGPFVLAGQAPARPAGSLFKTGGAIFNAAQSNLIVSSSSFTGNYSQQGGGAIMFGDPPIAGPITPTGASLTITGSSFDDNCTGGPGAAVAASQKMSVASSTFTFNFADSNTVACASWATAHPNRSGIRSLNLPNSPAITVPLTLAGAGGALFSSDDLSIDSSSFLTNTATVSPTGGGGAIDNYVGGKLQVTNGTFQDNAALYDGGAVYNDAGTQAVMDQSTFSGNGVEVDAGGAVANVGVLTVTNSVFTANSGAPAFGSFQLGGGAIMSAAPLALANTSGPSRQGRGRRNRQISLPGAPALFSLYVDHTRFISNSSEYEGGAIDASPAIVDHSTFVSNTASYGGAIDILDSGFAISDSTFIANAVITTSTDIAQEGGAIDTFASGLNHISVINSTFYANQAVGGAFGGAIDGENGVFGITNSTFLSNSVVVPGHGGAFDGDTNFFLHNTLVAFNAGGNCGVTLTLSGANLEFPGTTCGGASVQADPKALAPADNGGPTLTSALLPGSPAIDAGTDAGCPGTDQRGAARPAGSHCDIGAFEFGGLFPRIWLPAIR